MEDYLEYLIAHSHKRAKHMSHIRLVFERCRHYQIHLNPYKCIFFTNLGCILGFTVSTKGIMVEPLKVEAITQFPPLHTIRQLQSLQRKEIFL
jgi:hypothetical protein